MSNFTDTTTKTIAAINNVADAGNLEMKPPYQRNPVWTLGQMSYLIDTVLHGYPIPEIYLQISSDAQGTESIVVVDGQQRMRAVRGFVKDEFAIEHEGSLWGTGIHSHIQPDDKKRFFEYKFVVRQLPNVEDEVLRNIFQRLNRNVVALNKQELRHATYDGKFIKLVEQISSHAAWSEIGIFSSNDVRRMLDCEYISELAVLSIQGPQNKKASLDRWYQTLEENFENEEQVSSVFEAILGVLLVCLPNIRKTRWRKKSDFYTLFGLLSQEFTGSATLTLLTDGGEVLDEFQSAVTTFLASGQSPQNQSVDRQKAVASYSRAVHRAASDLTNRKYRATALTAFVADTPLPEDQVAPGADDKFAGSQEDDEDSD